MSTEHLRDWMPIAVQWEHGYPLVDWCYWGEQRFVEPFFDDTVEKRLRQPFNLLFQQQSDMETLCELQAVEPGLPPTGFIFHMSRCGSTLLAQMLAALPQNIVISEAGPIDSALRAQWRNPSISSEQRIRWLRAMVSVLARPRSPQERHFFIKFDSWHTVELPLIRRAFPHVPWIFLYREPLQVMVSHAHQPGAQMVRGLLPPQSIGMDWLWLTDNSPEEYAARVLNHFCRAALENLDEQGLLVNYTELPNVLWERLENHFKVHYSSSEIALLQEVTRFDAKNPTMYFSADTLRKESSATDTLRQATGRWLTAIYEALESRRHQEEAI